MAQSHRQGTSSTMHPSHQTLLQRLKKDIGYRCLSMVNVWTGPSIGGTTPMTTTMPSQPTVNCLYSGIMFEQAVLCQCITLGFTMTLWASRVGDREANKS